MASSPMLPPPLSLSLHRHLLYRPPPLPELYPGGAATTSSNPPSSSPSPSSPFLIPFFVVFISLLFFLLGFLMRDVFSFLHPSPSSPKRRTGISETILNSFPVLPYCNLLGTGFGSVSSECSVCLSEFERDDNVRLVTVCGHGFHKECVDNWLESHFTCPVCRADLRNEPDRRVVTGVCEVLSEE